MFLELPLHKLGVMKTARAWWSYSPNDLPSQKSPDLVEVRIQWLKMYLGIRDI